MKTKKTSILLFFLLFTGAILFSPARALAVIDATDCGCDSDEEDLNRCDYVEGYVIQPYLNGETADPIGAGKWPIINGGTKEWRYKVCSNASKIDCKSLPSWNYIVFLLPWQDGETGVDYYLSSLPVGASLLLPGTLITPKDKDAVIPDRTSGLKVNLSLNCGDQNGAIVSIFTTTEPQTGYCAEIYPVLNNGAFRTVLRGIDFDFVPPEPVQYFCDNRIEVRWKLCDGGGVEEVYIDGQTADRSSDAYLCDESGDICHELRACGSGIGGCYYCIDNPIYVNDDTVYYRP